MLGRLRLEGPGVTQTQLAAELERFLAGYGEPEPPQPADAAEIDTQLKSLSLPLSQVISATSAGTVLDIGAGKGILLQRLSSLDAFIRNERWIYVAADFEEASDCIFTLSRALRLHRRIDFLTLQDLQARWLSQVSSPAPVLVVIRNVLHELTISQTATLLATLLGAMQPRDSIIIQDLLVMHAAERGNACWIAECLAGVLEQLGFVFSYVVEPTARGNRWFALVGNLPTKSTLSVEQIEKIVRQARLKQFTIWKELGSLVAADSRSRQIALVDFDLQVAALQMQLLAADPASVPQFSADEERDITRATFTKHLAAFDPDSFVKSITAIERPRNFRDRAHNQNSLEEFLADTSPLVVITGGSFMGKTYLVQEVLARRAYDRQPLLIDVQATTSIWNVLEQYLAGLCCTVPGDLLATFRHLSFGFLEEPVRLLVERVSRNTVVCFDHFERWLDPNTSITDDEIKAFLRMLIQAPSAKVIVTSRREPNLAFLPDTARHNLQQPFVGRFPRGEHVENVLDDFVNRAALGIVDYPEELLAAIDQYPYLAALAGRVIRASGVAAFEDSKFVSLLRRRLRDALLRLIVTPESKPAMEVVGILRIPVPRRMLEGMAGPGALACAEQLGLIYSANDKLAGELLTGPHPLRGDRARDVEDEEQIQPENRKGRRLHVQAAAWYERLYREEHDPRWIRESYFHATVIGDPTRLRQFGVQYRDELFEAGEQWFLQKDFKPALAAFDAASNLGLATYLCRLRIAGCLMRVGDITLGEGRYRELIKEFSDTRGPKNSFIDSLLYCRKFASALQALREFLFSPEDDPWIAHEYGRAYLGLHQYADAVRAFEYQLSVEPIPIAYHMLARAYYRLGQRDDVTRVLEDGLAAHSDHRILQLDYAAHLIRLGHVERDGEAEFLLCSLPQTGQVLQQLVKLLCAQDRADEAVGLLNDRAWRIHPERYKMPIQVEISIAKGQFKNALAELRNVPSDDEHLVGLKKKTYLRWARSEPVANERKRIALEGLVVPMDAQLRRNIPILVTSARLARLAEEFSQFQELVEKISSLNSEVAELFHDEEDPQLGYWEEDPLDG